MVHYIISALILKNYLIYVMVSSWETMWKQEGFVLQIPSVL